MDRATALAYRFIGGQSGESSRQGRKLSPLPLAGKNRDGRQQHRCRPVRARQEPCILVWLPGSVRACFLSHH